MKLLQSLNALAILTVLLVFVLDPAFKKLPKYKLAIAILSARENFAQRDAIRSTWLSVLRDSKLSEEVYVAFLLANEDCEIPVNYRISKYLCEEKWLPSSVSSGVHDLVAFKDPVNLATGKFPQDYAVVAFDFVVKYDVVISGLAIPNEKGRTTVVQLWDLASDILLVESTYKDRLKDDSFWDQRRIDDHLLPKGFVGSVLVLCGSEPCLGMKSWFNRSSLHPALEISPILRYSTRENEFPEDVLPVTLHEMLLPASFSLELADPVAMNRSIESRSLNFEERLNHLFKISAKLEKESKQHHDIVLLSDIDGKKLKEVYRNLPRKVISFHQWFNENLSADFIMKTDDDSYVDVEKVLEIIKCIESSGVWIGNFRRNWIVDRYGKWEEHQYTSSVYPAYACGAGNVFSSDISKFLAENAHILKYYQGEDVSMGIWLSSLNVGYIQDDRFVCNDSCYSSMAVSTQNSISSLSRLWRNKMKCDNPCVCE